MMKLKQKPMVLSPEQEAKIDRLELTDADKAVLRELLSETICYMPDVRFEDPSLMAELMQRRIEADPAKGMSREQEETLFLQFNYARYVQALLRRKLLSSKRWRKVDIHALLDYHQLQLGYRDKIISLNMGLVLSMAKRARYDNVEFNDLVSEGSLALIRASEKFDCSRGLKFSTYACQALFKAFSRVAKQTYRHRSIYAVQLEPSMQRDDTIEQQREAELQDQKDAIRAIFERNLAELSKMEQQVVNLRFSLDENLDKPLTLKEVGNQLGLTKERIRQIQNQALEKLRDAVQQSAAFA